MTKPKNLEQLRAEKERAETQLAQEQHKLERLENRKKYLEKGERTKRTHRLASWEFHCFSTASAAFHKVLRSAYDRGAFAGSRISLWTIPRFSG